MPLKVEGSNDCVAECPQNMRRSNGGKGFHCEFEEWCNVMYPEGYVHTTTADMQSEWVAPECCASCVADDAKCYNEDPDHETDWCCHIDPCPDMDSYCHDDTADYADSTTDNTADVGNAWCECGFGTEMTAAGGACGCPDDKVWSKEDH